MTKFRFVAAIAFAAIGFFAAAEDTRDQEILVSRMAFSSGNKSDKINPLWQPIITCQPQLWIWTGDNIYADTKNMSVMKSKYDLVKENSDYKTLCLMSEIIGIWDDHDFGANNIGKEYTMKEESQQEFLDFLDVPKASPRRTRKGAYASHVYGPNGQRVKVILLDARYHRDAPGPQSDILGAEQWNWLEKELSISDANINLLVCGIQIIPEEHNYEKWANFPKSRASLFRLIGSTGAKGVILVSGDRHIAEISMQKGTAAGYPLYDITASGMTHSWATFTGEPNKHRIGKATGERNFGIISVNWNANPIALNLEIRGRENKLLLSRKVLLSTLEAFAPEIISREVDTAWVSEVFAYHARAMDKNGTEPSIRFEHAPSWARTRDSTIWGIPPKGAPDTSFVVIADDGFLADTVSVAIMVQERGPGIVRNPPRVHSPSLRALASPRSVEFLVSPVTIGPLVLIVHDIGGQVVWSWFGRATELAEMEVQWSYANSPNSVFVVTALQGNKRTAKRFMLLQ